MKALGTGIGGFALTDVEVCRTTGKGATRNAPYLGCTARRPSWPAPRARAPSTCPSPTPTAWRSLSSWRSRHRARRPDPRRNAGGRRRRARDRLARDLGGPRRHGGGPRRAPPARGRLRPARRRGGGQGQQRCRRPGRRGVPGPAGRPGPRPGGRRRPTSGAGPRCRPCDLVIDGAYGTGFRGSYDAPAATGGRRGAGHRHPLGRRCRQRRRAGRRPCRRTARSRSPR